MRIVRRVTRAGARPRPLPEADAARRSRSSGPQSHRLGNILLALWRAVRAAIVVPACRGMPRAAPLLHRVLPLRHLPHGHAIHGREGDSRHRGRHAALDARVGAGCIRAAADRLLARLAPGLPRARYSSDLVQPPGDRVAACGVPACRSSARASTIAQRSSSTAPGQPACNWHRRWKSSERHLPIGFVDRNPTLWRQFVGGYRVYRPDKLADLIERQRGCRGRRRGGNGQPAGAGIGAAGA